MKFSSFVARKRELDQIDQIFKKSLTGAGQVCFVTGDASSGKSTLVQEFCCSA